ncbi:hypothetical protein [Nocardiopsis synnemataformans]|uniref:hypothetical protein n=1 Tax=Nocardiopsis synnemataformans TaxID=61305 RepID=UPI003EC0699C
MYSSSQLSPTRKALRAELGRVLDSDPGANSEQEPRLSAAEHDYWTAWARCLIAAHGTELAASVYSDYADERQRALAKTHPGLTSWKQVKLSWSPVPAWSSDVHGYLCVVCGDAVPNVIHRTEMEAYCRPCARQYTESPSELAPLWAGQGVYDVFATPGRVLPEHKAAEDARVEVHFPHDPVETRTYVVGEYGVFTPQMSGLPNLTLSHTELNGESRDWIGLFAEATTEHEGRGFSIAASFGYDPDPDAYAHHPYGFRFRAARVTPTHTSPALPTEHTHLHQMLDQVLTGLYLTDLVKES